MQNTKILELQFTPRQIAGKRAQLRKALPPHLHGGELTKITPDDLALLFQLYDSVFLEGYFQQSFPGRVRFSLSTRMTRAAAKTHYPRNLAKLPPQEQEFEIRVALPFFLHYNHLKREKHVNGIKSKDALDALQLVFEHEMVHLMELRCYGKSSCNGERFKNLARQLFGHTESYHHLPTIAEIAVTRFGFQAGSQVRFSHEGREHTGFIAAVTKRATVMVPDKDGLYQDKAGQRFHKWYVPLSLLKKI